MMQASQELTPLQEHRFWVEVLEDHARFVRDHLPPEEAEWADWAERYIDMFWKLRGLLSKVKETSAPDSPIMKAVAKEIHSVAYGYYRLEGQLQHLKLNNKLRIRLSAEYFNGTLNENQEYLRLLNDYMQGKEPKPLPLTDLMGMWLEDQIEHAALLHRILQEKGSTFAEEALLIHQSLVQSAAENHSIQSYLRFTPPGFPIQLEHARATSESAVRLYQLVTRTLDSHQLQPSLSQITVRLLEHYLPETRYFLIKLSKFVPDIAFIPGCPINQNELIAQ
jgi:hypothetical protein